MLNENVPDTSEKTRKLDIKFTFSGVDDLANNSFQRSDLDAVKIQKSLDNGNN